MKYCSDPSRCRGTIYFVVLGSGMLIAVIGISSLLATRMIRESSTASNDYIQARLLAQSGLDMGLQWIAADANWRTNRTSGQWASEYTLGGGTFSLQVNDNTDNNLANNPDDPVTVISTGQKGESRHMLQVQLKPLRTPYDALASAIHVDGDVQLNGEQRLWLNGGALSSNGVAQIDGQLIGDASAATIAPGAGTVSGSYTTLPGPLSSPGAATVQAYRNAAVTRNFGALINNRVIAPQAGDVIDDTYGIIYHHSATSDLVIKNARIYGTLLVTTNGNKVTITDNVLIQPIRHGQPALIVDGNLAMQFQGGNRLLAESNSSINFNPSGAPYESVTDNDTSDIYPSEIRGLVHVTGDLTLDGYSRVVGGIICNGNAEIKGDTHIKYSPASSETLLPDYSPISGMQIYPDSWRQTVSASP